MRFFTARSVTLVALVPALLLFAFVPGCAKQSEGERCGDDIYGADNSDCADGLICKSVGDSNYRCCYGDQRISDSRCEVSSASGTAGSANAGSGNAGTSGAGVAGGSTDVGGSTGNGDTAGNTSATAGASSEAGGGG